MARHSSRDSNIIMSGTSGNWGVGVVTNNVRRWTATVTQQLIPATTKQDAGFHTDVYGTKMCEGTVTIAADTTTGIAGLSATAFTPGTTDPTVVLVLYDATTDHKVTGSAKVSQIDVGGISFEDEAELPELTYAFRMQGSFTVTKGAT